MADFSTLIASIEETIKTNGVQAITGQILQDEMLLMVSAINQLKQDTLEGYAFYGEPLADGGSASVTQNTFFLVTAGTYTINGNTFAVTSEGVSVVVYDSVNDEVRIEGLILPFDNAPTSGSSNPITSGAVADALAEIPANFAACLYDRRSAGTPQSPYTFRQSGGDGVDYLKRIKGRTLVWNQLVQNGDFSDGKTGWNGTGSVTDGVYSVSWPAQYSNNGIYQGLNLFRTIAGHQYYVHAWIQNMEESARKFYLGIPYDSGQAVSREYTSNEAAVLEGIYTATTTSTADGTGNTFKLFAAVGNDVSIKLANYFIIDLTLLGWVPSTVSEFRAVYPLSYYVYTPALLINNAATDLESTGFNQWDEEVELGIYNYNTGQPTPSTQAIRSKNYTPCFGGESYYFKVSGTMSLRILWYDADKNFISALTSGNYNNTEQTAPANAAYLRIGLSSAYGTTYNHDICINLSDPDRNGTYEPYWKATRHLGLDSIQAKEVGSDTIVTINGLDGVGDNVDLLKEGKTLIKNRARVDLGSLNWTKYDVAQGTLFRATISDLQVVTTAASVPTLKSAKYAAASSNDRAEKTISQPINATQVDIIDSAYSDAATFKTAMAGVILDYPLATPKEYELVEPIQPMLEVDELGTERRLPEDTADAVNAPFESDSNYSVSVANLVRKLSE